MVPGAHDRGPWLDARGGTEDRTGGGIQRGDGIRASRQRLRITFPTYRPASSGQITGRDRYGRASQGDLQAPASERACKLITSETARQTLRQKSPTAVDT